MIRPRSSSSSCCDVCLSDLDHFIVVIADFCRKQPRRINLKPLRFSPPSAWAPRKLVVHQSILERKLPTHYPGVQGGDIDLGEMIREELTPFGPRLVVPVEERYVSDLRTEGSEESRFELRRA